MVVPNEVPPLVSIVVKRREEKRREEKRREEKVREPYFLMAHWISSLSKVERKLEEQQRKESLVARNTCRNKSLELIGGGDIKRDDNFFLNASIRKIDFFLPLKGR